VILNYTGDVEGLTVGMGVSCHGYVGISPRLSKQAGEGEGILICPCCDIP
jgi:hypothetical protein